MARKLAFYIGFLVLFGLIIFLVKPAPQPVQNIIGRAAKPPTANVQRIGPANLYPDPKLTAGKAETLNPADLTRLYHGQTYSQSHRNVPQSEKNQVYAEYGITSHQTGQYEVDHFYPECGGGSNDISNLWPEPATNIWNGTNYGFHQKDDLETEVCKEIKAGTLAPKDAYAAITNDWVAYYLKMKPPHVNITN